MKSKLIPGKIQPISFIFVIPILILAMIFAQISFNVAVNFRLHQLESQTSPCEVEIDDSSEENPEVVQSIAEEETSLENANRGSYDRTLKSLGNFNISYYCPCESCCGKTDGITFSGTNATPNRTIAVDPDVIPLGTQVLIDGILYTAEDIGGAIQGNRIDIFVESHQYALEQGRHQSEVFVLE